MKPIRVLIVDDSPTVQSVLTSILSENDDIKVVGTASDPFEAKEMILKKGPDVVTLDVEMPRMDGIKFLKRLMSYRPLPVIMFSSYTRENSFRTFEALDAGAVDFIAKPERDLRISLPELKEEITTKVRAAARARVNPSMLFRKVIKPIPALKGGGSDRIVAIGASTGGAQAIQRVLEAMPPNVNGTVIVVHMIARFTKGYAERLNSLLPFEVKEAEDRDRLDRGKVLVAPGGWHLLVDEDHGGYCIRLKDDKPVKYHRPSIDVFFHSVANTAGSNAIGVLLTGMGNDGADGLLAIKNTGALTIAQDEATSVVFGMPRAAIELGAAQVVAPLNDIADIILEKLK